jgi:hypothetical protein
MGLKWEYLAKATWSDRIEAQIQRLVAPKKDLSGPGTENAHFYYVCGRRHIFGKSRLQ